MGEHAVVGGVSARRARAFLRRLLDELRLFERMWAEGRFDTTTRIGAEQELMLVDADLQPASVADAVLERLTDPRFTSEIARFNLEANA
ncbi:MAG: hypothetical protein ACK4N5_06180, partial [Myxococcales bacterium]